MQKYIRLMRVFNRTWRKLGILTTGTLICVGRLSYVEYKYKLEELANRTRVLREFPLDNHDKKGYRSVAYEAHVGLILPLMKKRKWTQNHCGQSSGNV